MLFVILLCFLGLLLLVIGLLVLLLLSVLMILLSGLTLLAFWLSGFLFLDLCIGLPMVEILGLVVFLMLSFLSYMSCGLVRGWFLRRLILVIFGLGVQFQCRLFPLVQALIFGARVDLLVL